MKTSWICKKTLYSLMILLLMITAAGKLNAQSGSTRKARTGQSSAQPILGKTKSGGNKHLSAFGPEGGDGVQICPEYIPIQSVEMNSAYVQQQDLFYYTVTLARVSTTVRYIQVILRPILQGGGLGDGYTWSEQIPAGQKMYSFSASATLPPWPPIPDLPNSRPLPVGSYLLEVYQNNDPPGVPHKTAVLQVIPQGGAGVPIYTPITLVTVDGNAGAAPAAITSSIPKGNLFYFTITMSEVLYRDIQAHVMVKITIETVPAMGTSGMVLNTWQEEMPKNQKGHTFTHRAEDSSHVALPAGKYILRAVRADGETTPPSPTTFDVTGP